MTGINAWVEMEHQDHEPGVKCRDCEPTLEDLLKELLED